MIRLAIGRDPPGNLLVVVVFLRLVGLLVAWLCSNWIVIVCVCLV